MGDANQASGRHADSPKAIGGRGWKRVLRRVAGQLRNDHIALIAAAVAFFGFLAIPPALASLIALYGLLSDPSDVQTQLSSYRRLLPPGAYELIRAQLERLTESPRGLGWGAVVGLVVSVWAANRGIRALVEALNIAYNERDSRGFFKLNALTLGFTLAGLVMVAIIIALVAVTPAALDNVGLGTEAQRAIDLLRWPLLAVLVGAALAVLYAFGPDRRRPQLRWASPGALFAVLAFLLVSGLFSFYVSHFGAFNEIYGSVATVAVLMLWLYLSALVTLVGAELNAELEHHVEADSTKRPDRPLGERDAYVADHVAR